MQIFVFSCICLKNTLKLGKTFNCTKNDFDQIISPAKQENLGYRKVLVGEF